jgi:hypothetical protein
MKSTIHELNYVKTKFLSKTKILFLIIFVFAIIFSCKKETNNTNDNTNDSTCIDIDGNVYQTIRIGTQVWMQENLKTTRYKDGTAIPTGLSDTAWENTTSGAYAIYDNNTANYTTYGKLYNWYAVNTGKLAPA